NNINKASGCRAGKVMIGATGTDRKGDQSSATGFETSPCRAISEDLPPSLIQHRSWFLVFDLTSCVHGARKQLGYIFSVKSKVTAGKVPAGGCPQHITN